MTNQTYIETQFPRRVWEQTWRGGWASRPMTAEDRASRAELLSQMAGRPQEYQPREPHEE